MGRLIYSLNVSLDGYVETPDHGLEWGLVDAELHSWFNGRLAATAASLYGRRLYELMAGYWPTAHEQPDATETELEFARLWTAAPKIVFSHSLREVRPGDRLVAGDVAPILADIRRDIDGDLEVGGPNLAAQFLASGLVDEIHPVVHPVVLGAGTPFLPSGVAIPALELLETRTFASGVIALRYRVRR